MWQQCNNSIKNRGIRVGFKKGGTFGDGDVYMPVPNLG